MQAEEPRRTFLSLDGLRAVGAVLVVMRHVPFLFGPIAVPESFLAVDLFYLVSGFVVAHAYRARLEAGGFFWTFVKTRLIRLYPLYFFGIGLGVISALIAIVTDPGGWWTGDKLLVAIVTGLFMFPFLPGMPSNGSSLDGPTWTLLPELIANFVYAALARFMNWWGLGAIIALSGAGVIFAELHYRTLDVGFGATQGWAALARVGFSFFSGIVLFRLFGHKQKHIEWASWACVAALTIALAWRPDDDLKPWFELGVVMMGFPILLVLAGCYEPSERTGKVFSRVGLASYGVYLLHQPLGNLVRVAIGRNTEVPTGYLGLSIGALFLIGVIGVSILLDTYFDAPVRKVLRGWFLVTKRH